MFIEKFNEPPWFDFFELLWLSVNSAFLPLPIVLFEEKEKWLVFCTIKDVGIVRSWVFWGTCVKVLSCCLCGASIIFSRSVLCIVLTFRRGDDPSLDFELLNVTLLSTLFFSGLLGGWESSWLSKLKSSFSFTISFSSVSIMPGSVCKVPSSIWELVKKWAASGFFSSGATLLFKGLKHIPPILSPLVKPGTWWEWN